MKNQYTDVYAKSDLLKKTGVAYQSDTVYMVGTSKAKTVKIIYNLSSGGYKAGWVSASKIE